MKYLLSKTKVLLFIFVSTLALTACEDDDWWTRESISGTWQIVEVTDYTGACPYYSGDYMEFRSSGYYYAYGRNNFNESGYWDVSQDMMTIDFDGDGRTDLAAQIMQLQDYYMVLYIVDYVYGADYTLRLMRY